MRAFLIVFILWTMIVVGAWLADRMRLTPVHAALGVWAIWLLFGTF